jgi:hypothetical protein
MLKLKHGVTLYGLQPEMLYALDVATTIYDKLDIDCVVTSSRYADRHGNKSRHYSGLAVDLRTHGLLTAQVNAIVVALRHELGPDYDVLFEAEGTPSEHIHIEFDPKGTVAYPKAR